MAKVLWILSIAAVCSAHAQQSCKDLKNLRLDHVTIVAVQSVDAVPRHCEVTGIARPTADSEIGFMIGLPPKDEWNGKYMQAGSGGWAGSISPSSLMRPLSLGYAVSATDDGHRANPRAMPDASFAVGHPEKLIDFGFRAVHETAVLSKAIVQAFYGKAAARNYFSGCSDGGREALMEAERYPEDFDGIVAGAPANYWTHHLTGFVWNEIALKGKPESMINVKQLQTIQTAALVACDALDGVKDGVIEDPRKCHFDPAVLLCHGAAGDDCLTQPQIDALRKIHSGPKNPRTGEQIYPGYEYGTEADPAGWSVWIVGPVQAAFGNSFYSQAVFEGTPWDWRIMDFDHDLRIADEKTAAVLNSYNPDLRSFRDHGGKLIQYHGWGDAAIAPRDSIDFYEKAGTFMKKYPDPRRRGDSNIESFYRLFMAPGLQHCTGGPGATSFGNAGAPAGVQDDADHDVVLALDRWVTQDVAPDKIIASGVTTKPDGKNAGEVRVTRPLCAYPAVAHYKGQGDPNLAENFSCVRESAK